MDYKKFWDENSLLYNTLEEQKCLCRYNKSPEEFFEILKACLDELDVPGEKEDCQLLSINMLRLLAETYSAEIGKYQRICSQIQTYFRFLSKEDMFYFMIDRYLTTGNQHLSWSFAKCLSAILYGTPLDIAKEWINFIVKNSMLQSSDDKCVHLMELLNFIISPALKTNHYKNDDSLCQNTVNDTLPLPKDYYFCVCSELAPLWKRMTDVYADPDNIEDKKEVAFLLLWKLIINGPLQNDLSAIYLNKKFILDILCHAKLSKPSVASLYVDVVIKIIFSNLKCRPWKEDDSILIEKSVTSVLSSGLLQSLPIHDQEFCNTIKRASSCGSLNMSEEMEPKIVTIEKKMIFILMNLLAEFQNMQLLCESYQKIIAFINHKNMLSPLWLVTLFLDDDDLLFGIMLASLRIYKNFLNENNISYRMKQSSVGLFLLHDINPHALFIKLLLLLGCDHNELISFLVSDETCCLLYLTEYLKFLQNEKDLFIKTYIMIMSDKKFSAVMGKECELVDVHNKSDNVQAQCDSMSAMECTDETSKLINTKNNSLVTYSSSSSEDNDSDDDLTENLLKVVSVLTNLRNGIQKLVNIKEFPYNISTLLILLKSCEDIFR